MTPAGIDPTLLLDRMEQMRGRARTAVGWAAARGLLSDWEDSPKVVEFAALVEAVHALIPGASTVETGVFLGGTSAVLMHSGSAFHVGIDPFGFPGQAYGPEAQEPYGSWERVRGTLAALHVAGADRGVTYLHYAMGAQEFCAKNLLPAVGRVSLVHLDGDHGRDAVRQELEYFTTRVPPPVVYVLDDHDAHFPGVDEALRDFLAARGDEPMFERILHRLFHFSDEYGEAGFSAWLHTGAR